MNILKGVSLKLHSTMRLGGTADFLVYAKSKDDVITAEDWAEARQLPVRMIGDGSNIIWRDEGFRGLIIVNQIKGLDKISEDEKSAVYQIGAGENLDKIIHKLTELNLSGIEYLSLIPGTVGATPVQNVGAYGQDISQVLVSLEAYDRMEKEFVTITNKDCAFGYRSSRFKQTDNGRFLITSITIKLSKSVPTPPFYEALQTYLEKKEIKNPSIKQIRRAVIDIRSQKLPDPSKIANNGSFFANPIVNRQTHSRLVREYTDLKAWKVENGYKISAAWLIEKSGFKQKLDPETGMTTWKNQPLVLVNKKAKHTQDLINYQEKIVDKIFEQFGISLEREPEILP